MKVIFNICKYTFFTFICQNISFSNQSSSINSKITPNFSPYSQITEYNLESNQKSILSIANLININEFIFAFIFAFIQDSNKCSPAWDGDKNNFLLKYSIIVTLNVLRKNGIQYRISLGGADGKDLALGCKSEIELFESYEKINNLYKPVGLDFDLEGKILLNKVEIEKILNALVLFQKKYGETLLTFTIPIMPEGISYNEKILIKKAKLKNIKFTVNILAMNYDLKVNKNMANYAIIAAKNLVKFLQSVYRDKNKQELWQMVEITPMIGVNDIKTEVFTLANANNLRLFAKEYKLGSMHFWSLERDNPCLQSKLTKSCSGILTQKYEFIEIFNKK